MRMFGIWEDLAASMSHVSGCGEGGGLGCCELCDIGGGEVWGFGCSRV